MAPAWHAEDADAAEKRGDWFAALFHYQRLVALQPSDPQHRRDLRRGLRTQLDAWGKRLADGQSEPRAEVLYWMHRLQRDANLAGVRDEKALAALPAGERDAWKKLWADVADLARKAQGKK